jgi:sugar lactone lactonase YvrE
MKSVCCIAALAFALGSSAASAQFNPDDYYVSVPFSAAPGIYQVDAKTGVATPFALPMLVPHYGWFGNDGNLWVPDRGIPGLVKVEPDGTATAMAIGGFFDKPVTCIPTPTGDAWVVSDMGVHKIIRVEYDGTQTVMHDNTTANGLLNWPDGIAYDDEGNLFVANLGNDTIIKIDFAGNATLFSDDSSLIRAPGGLAIDGAGNLFVANYDLHTISRFRMDTGAGELFAGPDSTLMARPNDLKLSRAGGMLVSGKNGRVSRVDAMGNISIMGENPALAELDGVSVLGDSILCNGRYETYGTGLAGSGGFTPDFRAIFSPCAGQTVALDFRDFLGGTPALLVFGTSPLTDGSLKLKGAPLLVDPAGALFLTLPLFMPGSGAGNGDLTLQFVVPPNPALIGLELYHQVFAADPSLPGGVSASNGLKETFGN